MVMTIWPARRLLIIALLSCGLLGVADAAHAREGSRAQAPYPAEGWRQEARGVRVPQELPVQRENSPRLSQEQREQMRREMHRQWQPPADQGPAYRRHNR